MFMPGVDLRKAQVKDEDGSKTTNISKNLDQAQEDALIDFIIKIGILRMETL